LFSFSLAGFTTDSKTDTSTERPTFKQSNRKNVVNNLKYEYTSGVFGMRSSGLHAAVCVLPSSEAITLWPCQV
jgi:hypothetical protein